MHIAIAPNGNEGRRCSLKKTFRGSLNGRFKRLTKAKVRVA